MKKTDKKLFFALHGLLFLFSCTTILSKLAAREEFLSPRFVLFFGLEFVVLAVYALGWQQILKRLPLTVAFTNKAVTLVWTMVFGALLFHEQIRPQQILGCALAVLGVVLYVLGGEEESHEP